LRIKLIDPVNETAALRDRLARDSRLGIVIAFDIPTIRRHFHYALTTFDEKFPKRIDGIHATGEAAPNSDNGDTFFLHGGELIRRGRLINAVCGHVN
jgi:hypothetical protein